MRQLFLPARFFQAGSAVIGLFVLAFALPFLLPLARGALLVLGVLVVVDALLLYRNSTRVEVRRLLPRLFSLSDANTVRIELQNRSPQALRLTVIDELPVQFQQRNFQTTLTLRAAEPQTLRYTLRPLSRGRYAFGAVNVFMASRLGLLQRRYRQTEAMAVAVYPSVVQMKDLSLKAVSSLTPEQGVKKMRRIGHSYEFEQIKEYVRGDDYRSINWKATGRHSRLMVNQYTDERAQQVYCLIDKGRSMQLPFDGLTLLDYAINASLVISNVALQRYDKAGLLTFSDKIGTTLKAERSPVQLQKILQALYQEKERPGESNYELLYHIARKLIRGRSLVVLFTNFESRYALERVLPLLRRINVLHLLVVVFFENTEIEAYGQREVSTLEGIYTQTAAQNFIAEKRQIARTLRQHGIQTIYTKPEELSVNTVNKYLELKSRGLI